MKQYSAATSYMTQLDGLRALAIGAVLLHHFSGSAHIGRVNFATLHLFESPLNSLKHYFEYAEPIESRERQQPKVGYL